MPETVEMRAWTGRASCKIECDAGRADPSWWFPYPGESSDAAKAICASCPVAAECLAWAVRNLEEGIWAGTSRKQRQKLARPRDCVVCGKEFVITVRRAGAQPVTCSEVCGIVRRRETNADSDERRGVVKDRGKYRAEGHGRPSKYAAGCRCQVCRDGEKRRRAGYRGRARVGA